MSAILLVGTFTAFTSGPGVFVPDSLLWAGIDSLNARLSVPGFLSSDALEELFEEALELAFSSAFSGQIEDLRTDSYTLGLDARMELYIERAAPAISVLPMGESDNIGVNVSSFLLKSEPGSRAYGFFDLALDGFYLDGETMQPGTAVLPVWMERGDSSAQAVVNPETAGQWQGLWEAMRAGPEGAFGRIATETARGLSHERTP
ncbi:MAG: hypothetical protein R6V62_08235 [Candidatus Fermentibacteraceae bacterium]